MFSMSRSCLSQIRIILRHPYKEYTLNSCKFTTFSNLILDYCSGIIMATNRYCVDLAKRGTAGCKECNKKIEKGLVRIAKIIPNPFTDEGGEMKQWFHVKCIFTKLSRARATTKKIESVDDIEGWEDLPDEHKPEILQCLSEFSTTILNKTPQKKTVQKTKGKSKNVDEEVSLPDDTDSTPTKDDTLRQFRKICAELAEISEYTKKTAILSKFFEKGSDGSGFKGNLYLWVKMLLPMVEKRVYNLQTKQLIKLFSDIFGCCVEEMTSHFEESETAGDVAVTISTFFEDSKKCPPAAKSTLYLQEVDKLLHRLSQVSREVDQSAILTEIAKKCTGNDLKMMIRFIKHDLRINAGPKPILNAIHPTAYQAFQASRNLKDIVYRSIKQNAGTSSQNDLAIQSSLMTPVLPMLAMACKSYEDVFKRCPNGFYVEIKYDGERVQLHKRGNEFSYFSRSLKPVMPHKIAHLKDYIPKAFPHGNNLMLDCEILLVDKNGKPLPFGTLGAHRKNEFQDACVCLFVFDCLQFNDENLMEKPLWKRRKILKENMTPVENRVVFSEMKEIDDMNELKATIRSVFKQGLEGVVVKAKDSNYEPGKRHWLKIKKDYLKEDNMADSADLVVLGAFYGTGKFGGVMSIFLMGCYNTKAGKWCTVTKVHNGLTEEDVERLQKEMKMIKIGKDRSKVPSWLNAHDSLVPDFVVPDPKKSPVWEITGAEFTQTDLHTAKGISIRFPRLTRVRDDKSWKEATNLEELENLYKISKQTSDIIGLAVSKEEDENLIVSAFDKKKNNSFDKSSDSISDEIQSPKKKLKKEMKSKFSSKRKNSDSSDHQNPKNVKKEKDSNEAKKVLPDLFSDVKLHIPTTIENYNVLRRYFIAYDGHLLENPDPREATHAIWSKEDSGTEYSKGTKKVTVDWLWDSIKLQKILPEEMYKPKTKSS